MTTLDVPTRKAHLQKILTAMEAYDYKLDITNKTKLLTTISRLTVELCENIETLTHGYHDAITIAIAHIETKETAAAITSLCLKELKSAHQRNNTADVTKHTALSDDPDNDLGRIDLHISAERRIRHLIEALGDLAAHWYAQPDQPNEYIMREDALASAAHRSACTLIAANRTLIVN